MIHILLNFLNILFPFLTCITNRRKRSFIFHSFSQPFPGFLFTFQISFLLLFIFSGKGHGQNWHTTLWELWDRFFYFPLWYSIYYCCYYYYYSYQTLTKGCLFFTLLRPSPNIMITISALFIDFNYLCSIYWFTV